MWFSFNRKKSSITDAKYSPFTCRRYRDRKFTTPTWLTVSQTHLFSIVFSLKSSTSTSPIQTVPTPIPLATELVVWKVSTHYPYRCSNIQQLLLLLPVISNALMNGKSTTYRGTSNSNPCRTHPNPFFCETNAYPTIGMWCAGGLWEDSTVGKYGWET